MTLDILKEGRLSMMYEKYVRMREEKYQSNPKSKFHKLVDMLLGLLEDRIDEYWNSKRRNTI